MKLPTSPAMRPNGTLVLQNKIAPLSRIIFVISDSSPLGVGWWENAVYPIAASISSMRKQSLREMGRPWRGPRGVPDSAYSASNCSAASSAFSKKISLRQLTLLLYEYEFCEI
jgi:hypothetical protein